MTYSHQSVIPSGMGKPQSHTHTKPPKPHVPSRLLTVSTSSLARGKLTEQLTRNIIFAIDPENKQPYDGGRTGLRRWYKATISALKTLGLDIDELVKDEDFEDYADRPRYASLFVTYRRYERGRQNPGIAQAVLICMI